ncbi:uncharacterized protein BDW70DRAFT_64269 [Aspergillus foveolatus]|uniref:uncharacterized protein n=1 Tax=Aspergillus foveolatus TaxID=210207 RepID=UPI003CCD124A
MVVANFAFARPRLLAWMDGGLPRTKTERRWFLHEHSGTPRSFHYQLIPTATAALAISSRRKTEAPIRRSPLPHIDIVGRALLHMYHRGVKRQVPARGSTQDSRRHGQGLDPCGVLFLFLLQPSLPSKCRTSRRNGGERPYVRLGFSGIKRAENPA